MTPATIGGSIDTKKSDIDPRLLADAQRRGNERLYPGIATAGYLELRRHRLLMEEFFSKVAKVETILDVGSQYSPYTPIFASKCVRHLSMDAVSTPLVDIVCNAEKMSVADNSIDIILCTQVLEHTDHPQDIVNECRRVLKPGGALIVTVPSVFPMHGYPADRWRFMPQGLEFMLREFSSVKVVGEMDFAESWISTNFRYLHTLTAKTGPLERLANPCMHLIGNIAARALTGVLRPFTKNNFRAFSVNLWAEAVK